jgi:hypothetical protein
MLHGNDEIKEITIAKEEGEEKRQEHNGKLLIHGMYPK